MNLKYILSVGALLTTILVYSQPPPPPAGVPIDGGLGLLLAGGVAYGVKKLAEMRDK